MKRLLTIAVLLLFAWQQATAYCPYSDYSFDCQDGYCAKDEAVCDGIEDCPNGRDEDNCDESLCLYNDYSFDCQDDYCVEDEAVCDGKEDCPNGRDEDNCLNVGLVVGLTITGFVICIVLPIVICIVICCCLGVCAGAAAGSTRRTRVVTHTAPSAGPHTTVVTSNTSNMMQAPGGVAAYPPPYTANPSVYQPAPHNM